MNVLELVATLSLDSGGYEKGLDKAESRAGKLGSKLAGGAKMAAKGFAVAGAAAATGVAAITKSAIDGYADLEQLKGGVETLFGDSAQKVIDDANEAFKTAGMSANEYMETSIQSAAALINSLGGDQAKASELMNMSITDMADNVNKMGTSMESVQDAYRGFSRGNFTMLDNLALGFAGTKEGMQELLDKAKEISGVEYDINSYSDIVQAIHVVQDEMGITGTTAKEASETISGSISSLKSAWQNLVTGFADENADLDKLINNVVEAAETAFGNILPVAEKAMSGIADFVSKAAPILAEKLPEIIKTLLPKLIEASTQLISALGRTLPTAGIEIVNTLIKTINKMLPNLITEAAVMIAEFSQGLADSLPKLIPQAVNMVLTIVGALLENIDLLIDAAMSLAEGIGKGIIEAMPIIVEKIPVIIKKLVSALIRAIPLIVSTGTKLFISLVKNTPQIIAGIVKVIPRIISAIVRGFGKGVSKMARAGVDLMKGLAKGIINGAKHALDAAKNVASSIMSKFTGLFGINSPSKVFMEYGRYIDEGLAKGISDNAGIAQRAMASLGEIATDDFAGDAGFSEYGEEISIPVQGSDFSSNRDLTVILELDKMQLGKAVYKLNNEETQRVGVKLSGAYA